jgi:hypothetical protein
MPNPVNGPRQPGVSYNTQLDPGQERFFRQWVTHHNIPFNPDATSPQDYDMRGFYQGLMQGNPKAQAAVDPNDGRMHFNDYWKTPSHETFSDQSQWATPQAPGWQDDRLVTKGGRVQFDDAAKPVIPTAPPLFGALDAQ